MTGTRAARALAISSVALFVILLMFRVLVYRHMYIAPGDPYGLADIVEFLLGWMLIGLLSVSALIALVMGVRGPKGNRMAAGWLLFVIAVILLLLDPLHELAARWAI